MSKSTVPADVVGLAYVQLFAQEQLHDPDLTTEGFHALVRERARKALVHVRRISKKGTT